MKLSTRGKYGLYAMLYLAQKADEGPQPLKSIAQLALPDQYLEQLLGCLRKAGLVTTAEITVGHIIDAMEGPLNLSECAVEGEEFMCPHSGNCPARPVWEYLTERINALLYSISLQDMLDDKEMNRA